jgi:hypothetical protein
MSNCEESDNKILKRGPSKLLTKLSINPEGENDDTTERSYMEQILSLNNLTLYSPIGSKKRSLFQA